MNFHLLPRPLCVHFSLPKKMREQAAFPAVLLVIALKIVVTSVEAIPYQVNTQGFLKVLNRSEPLVLFRTKTGIQALSGNHTCIDNKRSVYYTVNKQIEYFSYSSVENYMLIISTDHLACYRNLYKSDWNNGMKRDLRRECMSHNYPDIRLYGLSINHHLVFSLSNKRLFAFNPGAPMCGFTLKQGGAGDQLHGVNFLHVTNFVRSQDRILLAYNDKLEEYTPSGDLLTTLKLEDQGEVLVSIDSDEAREHTFFFLYIQNRTDAIIRRYNTSFNDSASVVIFTAEDRTAHSIDVSSGLMAILMRQRHYSHRGKSGGGGGKGHHHHHSADDDEHFTEGDYVLQLRGSYPSHDAAGVLETYLCDAGNRLNEVIMVNRRHQRDVFYCDENPAACQNIGASKLCNADVIFRPQHQFTMDESKTEKELHRKMLITGLIGGLTLITLLTYRIAKHIWRI